MRRFLSILVFLTISLWLGGLVMIFVAVPTLFHTFASARAVAGNAAAGIFHAFERYQLVLAAISLIAVFLWRVSVRESDTVSGNVKDTDLEAPELNPAPQAVPFSQDRRSRLVPSLFNSSDNLQKFLNDLLTTQAVTVTGTEAAAFLVERGTRNEDGVSLPLKSHIRPDNSSPELRAAAINAFQDLIRTCLKQNRDGAIEIATPAVGGESQFCLITLLRDKNDVVAASAVITRCSGTELAREQLMKMQVVGGYFELYSLRNNSQRGSLVGRGRQQAATLKTACFALLSLATVAAASSTLFITPKIDAMRLRGETYGPAFGKLHGISMSLYSFESLVLLAATSILPSIIARESGIDLSVKTDHQAGA